MSPVTMTKNPEAAEYGALPSSPSVDGETTNLIQKKAEEAIGMAKEAKRTSRLSASLLVGAAALFFAGYAFSSSNPFSKQLQSKVPFLGDWYKVRWEPLGVWPPFVSKDEVADFCSFESFDIDSPDAASHPCARCYMLAMFSPNPGDIDVRHDVPYAEGCLDFAKCYYKGIKYQGREVTKADYTMKPFDENTSTCDSTLEFQNDYFRQNGHWTNPDEPLVTEDGFSDYVSYCFNDYFYHMGQYCTPTESWA